MCAHIFPVQWGISTRDASIPLFTSNYICNNTITFLTITLKTCIICTWMHHDFTRGTWMHHEVQSVPTHPSMVGLHNSWFKAKCCHMVSFREAWGFNSSVISPSSPTLAMANVSGKVNMQAIGKLRFVFSYRLLHVLDWDSQCLNPFEWKTATL